MLDQILWILTLSNPLLIKTKPILFYKSIFNLNLVLFKETLSQKHYSHTRIFCTAQPFSKLDSRFVNRWIVLKFGEPIRNTPFYNFTGGIAILKSQSSWNMCRREADFQPTVFNSCPLVCSLKASFPKTCITFIW